MRFAFDDDQLGLRDGLRAMLAKECTPQQVRATWALPQGIDRGRWRALAGLGVTGCLVPSQHGGLGLDETWMVLLLEECGRAALPEPLAATAAIAAPLLRDAVPGEVSGQWLARIAAGDAVATVVPPQGRYAEAADAADVLLGGDGDAVHVLDPSAVALAAQPAVDPSTRWFSVETTGAAIVSVAGAGPALRAAAARADLASAAALLGAGARLVELAAAHAMQRHQFGAPIGSFQAVKHHLAGAHVEVEFARPLVYRAAWSIAAGQVGSGGDASLARGAAGAAATLAARVALQVHGAIGYTWEHDLHLWMNRVLALTAR